MLKLIHTHVVSASLVLSISVHDLEVFISLWGTVLLITEVAVQAYAHKSLCTSAESYRYTSTISYASSYSFVMKLNHVTDKLLQCELSLITVYGESC